MSPKEARGIDDARRSRGYNSKPPTLKTTKISLIISYTKPTQDYFYTDNLIFEINTRGELMVKKKSEKKGIFWVTLPRNLSRKVEKSSLKMISANKEKMLFRAVFDKNDSYIVVFKNRADFNKLIDISRYWGLAYD